MSPRTLRHLQTPKDSPCIWEQAGVVPRKVCHRDYDCTTCGFDRALGRAAQRNEKDRAGGAAPGRGKAGQIVSWKERFLREPAWRRPCIHHLKGRIPFRGCPKEYHCHNCDFDQFFADHFKTYAVVTPIAYAEASGIRIPQGYYLHPGHLWAKVEEGNQVRVGLDDFAQRVFGPLDRIEAPLIGKELTQGRPGIFLFAGRNKASALSPVSGVITSLNPALREKAGPSQADPYAEGWVATLHCKNLRRDLPGLMLHTEALAFLEKETAELDTVLEGALGPLATDGGYLHGGLLVRVPQLGWHRLQRRFLRT